jgi:GH24 family phage-related lysozyme (muramidase)
LASENGLELIRKSETLELVVYLCPAGKWTISYGHTGPEVIKGMEIDIFDAIIMLRNDVKKAESAIAELVKVRANGALQLLTEVIAASDKEHADGHRCNADHFDGQ